MWTPEDRRLVGAYGAGQALSNDQSRLISPCFRQPSPVDGARCSAPTARRRPGRSARRHAGGDHIFRASGDARGKILP